MSRAAAGQKRRAAIFGLVLTEEGQIVLVENFEESVPADLFKLVLGLTEIDAQHAAVAAIADTRRLAAARFGPFADFIVIGGRLCFAHSVASVLRDFAVAV